MNAAPQDYMHAASAPAQALAQLGWWSIIVFCIGAAIVWLLLLWIVARRRGTFAEHAPAEAEAGVSWIVIGGLAIPAAVFFGFFALSLPTMYASAHANHAEMPADIRVTGRQWWFEAEYLGGALDQHFRVPTEIHIPVGEDVHLELVSRDVIHSFWIPKLAGKTDLVPGMVNRMRLHADAPGTYAGECSEFCGVQHAHMRLTVIAQPRPQYDAWLAAQRAQAAEPATDVAHGRDVFLGASCALCHTVRGTDAHGLVGPDLTHVASRQTIAGGALDNDTANLAAWVTDAQSLKPGAQMPSLRQLSGPDLRALVSYLQSLH